MGQPSIIKDIVGRFVYMDVLKNVLHLPKNKSTINMCFPTGQLFQAQSQANKRLVY